MAEHLESPGRRVAQRRLAAEVTTLVHGPAEVEAAELASGALFGRGELADLPEPTLAAALREAGAVDLPRADAPTLTDALVATRLVDSRSAARRAVADGGAYVNNERVDDPDLDLAAAHLLHGSWLVIRKGKRSVSGIKLT
jgi:tyrosyl-tRNA synthetase